eukprot:Awhi_evm1s2469
MAEEISLEETNDDWPSETAFAISVNRAITPLRIDSNIGPGGAKILATALTQDRVGEDGQVSLALHLSSKSINLRVKALIFEEFDLIMSALQINNVITHFELTDNQLGFATIEKIASVLRVNTILTNIDLAQADISTRETMVLASALKVNDVVTEIDFGSNRICAHTLGSALKVNNAITCINLSNNHLGVRGAVAVASALKENHTIRKINLSCNDLGFIGALEIAGALRYNDTITEVDVSENDICCEGADALGFALKVNKHLISLNLGSNAIGDEGVESLSSALKVNRTLSKIWLEDNEFGEFGVEQLASMLQRGIDMLAGALKVNETIFRINLSGNEIRDGIVELAAALRVNKTISVVNLSSNVNFGDSGAELLASTLKSNNTIHTVDLATIGISDFGFGHLKSALEVNQTITSMKLDKRECASMNVIEPLLKNNRRRLVQSIYQNRFYYKDIFALIKCDLNNLPLFMKENLHTPTSVEEIEEIIHVTKFKLKQKIVRIILHSLLFHPPKSQLYYNKISKCLSIPDLEMYRP